MKNQKRKPNTRNKYVLLAVAILLLDQLIKYFVAQLTIGYQKILIPGTLILTHVTNTGVSFGTFQGNNALWAWVAVVVLGLLIYWYETFKTTLAEIAYWMIIAGLFGNLIDRIFRGAVVDMFNVPWFAVFNVADAAISVAVVLLLIDEVRSRVKN